MKFKYTFSPYSCYDQYTTKSDTDNISNVIDRMIRVTAKITEQFSSDIMYDIEALKSSVKIKDYFQRLLIFREGGVNSYDLIFRNNDYKLIKSEKLDFGIQTWLLTHNIETNETIFIRVIAKEEKVD